MRPRAIAMLLGWMTATLVTGLLAWTAVQVAGSQSAPQPVRPLTAAEVEALPAAVPVTSDPAVAPTATVLSPDTGSTATTDGSAEGSDTAAPESSAPGEPKVFHTSGGSVGVSIAGNTVSLAWATPASGFQVEVDDAGPEQVLVEFESATYESSVLVTAANGVATPEIAEGPKDQSSSPDTSEPGDDNDDGSDKDD